MSAWRNAVDFHTPALTATQFCVLAAVAGNANDEGLAFPSMATIAIKAHCAENNARRTIRQLEEGGYLKTLRRVRGNGSYTSNLYQLAPTLLDCVSDCRCPVAVRARTKAAPTLVDPLPAVTPDHSGGGINELIYEETEGTTHTPAPVRTHVPYKATEKTPVKADPQTTPQTTPETASVAKTPPRPAVSRALPARLPAQTSEIAPGANLGPTPVVVAEQIWRRAYLADAPPGLLAKKLNPLLAKEDPRRVLTAWDTYCNNTGAQYVNVDRFVSTWGSWENGPPAKSGPTSAADPLAAHREVFGG